MAALPISSVPALLFASETLSVGPQPVNFLPLSLFAPHQAGWQPPALFFHTPAKEPGRGSPETLGTDLWSRGLLEEDALQRAGSAPGSESLCLGG